MTYIRVVCTCVVLFALCDALVVLFRGRFNIYMLLFVSIFCKCRELTENKYEKKQRGSLPTLTDGKGFAVGGLTGKKTRGGSLCILATLGIPNFRLCRQLGSSCRQRGGQGDPGVSALPSALLRLWAKRGGFAVSFATAMGKACRYPSNGARPAPLPPLPFAVSSCQKADGKVFAVGRSPAVGKEGDCR